MPAIKPTTTTFTESNSHLTLTIQPPQGETKVFFPGSTIKGVVKSNDSSSSIFRKYSSVKIKFSAYSLGAKGVIPGVSGQDTTGLDKHVFFESNELVFTRANNEGGYISFEIQVPTEYSCRCWKTSQGNLEIERDLIVGSMKTPFEDLSRVSVIYDLVVTAVKPGFLKSKDILSLDLPFGVKPATRETFELLTEISNEVTSQGKLKYDKGENAEFIQCHLTCPPILTPPHFTLPWTLTLALPSSPSSLPSLVETMNITSSIHRKNSTRGANKPGRYGNLLEGFKEQSTYDVCRSTKPVNIRSIEEDSVVIDGQIFVLADNAITIRGCAVNVEYFLHVTLSSDSLSKRAHTVELPIFIPSTGYFTDNPPPGLNGGGTPTYSVGINGYGGNNGHNRFGDGDSLPDYDHENGLDFEDKKEAV